MLKSLSQLPLEAEIELKEREGLYCYHRGSFIKALSLLTAAADGHWRAGQFERHLETLTYVLRILAEREEFERVRSFETHVASVLENEDLSAAIKARAYYTLGVCHSFQESTASQAWSDYMRSIEIAADAGLHASVAKGIYGLAFLSYGNGRLEEALQHTDRLMQVLERAPVPDVAIGVQVLRGLILRNKGLYDDALQEVWTAYRALKSSPNIVMYIHAVHGLGSVYLHKGDLGSARQFLDLARHAIDEAQLPRLKKMVDRSLDQLSAAQPRSSYDFRVDVERGLIFDRWDKAIDVSGQFVIRDLLLSLARTPDRLITKEEIVKETWGEIYDPVQHDNKIYVTIRRLRRLLGGEGPKACDEIVLRDKGGYRLNPKLRILLV